MNNLEQEIKEYLNNNKIEINEKGEFESYIVIDSDDTEHVLCAIFNNVGVMAYTLKEAMERLKENEEEYYYDFLKNDLSTKSIRDELLEMKSKVVKIVINKDNIINVRNNILHINKYKVIGFYSLTPELKFKINGFSRADEAIMIVLYNNITLKREMISIDGFYSLENITTEEVRCLINDFLDNNELEVKLINESSCGIKL